jgi:hypothetical protein
MLHRRTYFHFAQEFELLAINLDVCEDPEQRTVLLGRMKAVIDEIDELLHQDPSYPVPMGHDYAN